MLACASSNTPPNLGGVAISNRLTLQVHGIEFADSVVYQEDNQTYTVTPPAGQRLLAAEATLTNPEAENAVLVINGDSATLSDKRNNSFEMRDPREGRQVTPNATAAKYYTPFLWGSFNLRRGYGIRGWLFFLVSQDTKIENLGNLSWRSLDSLTVTLTPVPRS
jgi:hypothetical protein